MKRIILFGMFIFWTSFIFYNSLQVGSISSQVSGRYVQILENILSKININYDNINLSLLIRKTAHMIEFFILGVLCYLALLTYQLKNKFRLILNIILSVLVAAIDEIIQLFVEGRNGSIKDVAIDSIGILIATLLMFIIFKKKQS